MATLSEPFVGHPREVLEMLPKAISEVRNAYFRSYATTTTTTTTEPPVIWFPNQGEDCEQESGGGGGFSAFSLLALVMSATNLVGLLASNANNNINNNNNDNNLNNNNVQDVNENNANNNVDLLTMVTFGAGKKRRKREIPDGVFSSSDSSDGKKKTTESFREEGQHVKLSDGVENDLDSDENFCWAGEEENLTAQEVTAVVSMLFLRAHVQASLTDHLGCLGRSLCVTSAMAAEWGDLARLLASSLSEFHVDTISERTPGIDVRTLLEAGRDGLTHQDSRECRLSYLCPSEVWNELTGGEWHHLIGERLNH